MKKNNGLIIILLLLTAITAFFFFRKSSTTLEKELTDFSVKDTASITKIFLADKSGKSVLLEKDRAGAWSLNGKDKPQNDNLKLLFQTLYRMTIKSRVAKAAYNNVVKTLAATGIKCEIYLNYDSKPYKVIYVGGQTADAQGTFMILENSEVPFIVEIPGSPGYLTPRFSTDAFTWMSTILFSASPSEIRSVTVNYANYADKSFSIIKENNSYRVESVSLKRLTSSVDSVAVENYLSLYRNIHFETLVKTNTNRILDSLTANPPVVEVSLISGDNKSRTVAIYPMPISERSLTREDSEGNPLKYDLDRMYGIIKPENKLVTIQHFTFDKVLRELKDFEKKGKDRR